MITKRSLHLFHKAADEIPAYRRFLQDNNIDATSIRSPSDLLTVPFTSKKTYLAINKSEDLIWPNDTKSSLLLCATSGSTGEPYYFPRNDALSVQYSDLIENFLNYSSFGDGSTLVIVGFGMGVWIGGVLTMRAYEIAGERMAKPISILPTGNNKPEIFRALRKLSPNYSQTILVGYPPLIKELIDESVQENLNLKNLNLRFMFAAEAFSESFRNYICDKTGIKNPLKDTLNIYGSADNGAMAYETPLSILVRRLTTENSQLFADMFGDIKKLPTLAQYNPEYIEFESIDSEIILSAPSALPLVRYAIGDHGGVLNYADIDILMQRHGIDLEAEIQKAGIQGIINPGYPFIYIYERTDMSTTLYGINIFPEYIRESLITETMTDYFSGLFTMVTKNDDNNDQYLQVNLEMQKNVPSTKRLEALALEAIETSLMKRSSEFADLASNRSTEGLIQIVLWPKGDPRYFSTSTKQKWVEKS